MGGGGDDSGALLALRGRRGSAMKSCQALLGAWAAARRPPDPRPACPYPAARRRGADGGELLQLTLSADALAAVLEDMDAVAG